MVKEFIAQYERRDKTIYWETMREILASEEDIGARKQLQSMRDWVNNKLQKSIEPRHKMTKDFNDGYANGWADAYLDLRLELAKREESL